MDLNNAKVQSLDLELVWDIKFFLCTVLKQLFMTFFGPHFDYHQGLY